jgi:antitoxin (DNA-binding transcriptional repressor) of toxin-antitoxin stability system
MVAERLTKEDLARRLPEVLDRVRGGGRFAIERDGVVIAEIGPGPAKLGTTWREFIAKVGDLSMPGDGFADDLEAVQATQGVVRPFMWESDDDSN